MALGCHVHHRSRFDRKNYFYPDLPKAYQISQFYRPLCEGGALTIQTSQGEKRVGITRIHIEEDAGKLLHDEANGTALDMNRCGVPLIEDRLRAGHPLGRGGGGLPAQAARHFDLYGRERLPHE